MIVAFTSKDSRLWWVKPQAGSTQLITCTPSDAPHSDLKLKSYSISVPLSLVVCLKTLFGLVLKAAG